MIELPVILNAVTIFLLRIVNMSVSTMSIITVIRGRRRLAMIFVFFEALIWAVVIAGVIDGLNNFLYMFAYAAGFSAGNYVGLMLEARFITSYVNATVTTSNGGHELAVALRLRGFGVTETVAEDGSGRVTMLNSVILRSNLPRFMEVVSALNPEAFVSVDNVRSVHRGWFQSLREH